MAVRFLDTNVFLRHLVADDPSKSQRCLELFRRVRDGTEQVTTSESVIAEVVYVLTSRRLYAVSRARVRDLFLPLLTLRGMRLPNRRVYLRALEVFVEHDIDFEDALTVAHVEQEGLAAILSYDRDFDRIPGIARQEP